MAFENHNTYVLTGAIANNSNVSILNGISPRFERHYFNIRFYNSEGAAINQDSANRVSNNSMAGSVTFEVSDNGDQFGTITVGTNTNGVLNLGDDDYERPNALGTIKLARIDMSNITSAGAATHFRLEVNSYSN